MTFEEYQYRGYYAVDYIKLSQWQRLREVVAAWKKSKAPDKGVQIAAIWDASDESQDYIRPDDWWKLRHWRWGVWVCQNFHHIDLGPVSLLVAT